jgi:hypothetical protein
MEPKQQEPAAERKEPQLQEPVAEGNTPQRKPLKRIVIGRPDIEILKFIHDYRLLHIRQLELLTGRKYHRLYGRFKGMLDQGYLGRLERPWQKDTYYIKKPGLVELLKEGLISDEEAARRVREGDLKSDDFLHHELMLSDFHIMLTLATRNSPIELVEWKEGTIIRDSFRVAVNGQYQDIVIEPDAFFTLRGPAPPAGEKAARSFLLEADRLTMPKIERPGSRRFNDKIRKYEHYIREFRPKHNSLRVPHVSILTVTLTNGRRDSLARSAAETITEKDKLRFFLFGSLQDLLLENPASVFHPVFIRPGDTGELRQLFKVAEITASA